MIKTLVGAEFKSTSFYTNFSSRRCMSPFNVIRSNIIINQLSALLHILLIYATFVVLYLISDMVYAIITMGPQ